MALSRRSCDSDWSLASLLDRYARWVRVKQAFDVAVPPEAVFAWFADPARSFAQQVKGARVTPEGPLVAGTTFHVQTPREQDHVEGIVEVYDPPHRLEQRMWLQRRPESGGAVRLGFTATERGTHVTGTVETLMPPALQIASMVLMPVLWFQARRGSSKIAALIEDAFRAGEIGGSAVTRTTSVEATGSQLLPLEREVLDTMLAGDHPTLVALRAQLALAEVRSRLLTGVGFYTELAIPRDAPAVEARDGHFALERHVGAEIEGLQRGAGFVLFVEHGFLDTLEGFTYDEPWPDRIGAFRVYREPASNVADGAVGPQDE